MTLYGDPARLHALAREVRGSADDVVGRCRAMTTQASRTQWESTAAQAHRASVGEHARALMAVAGELDEAARLLDAHAVSVQHRLDEIHAAERAVRAWFGHAESLLSRGVSDLAGAMTGAATGAWSAVSSGFGLLGDDAPAPPPWLSWPWTPTALPVPGHLDWLDAATTIRQHGFHL